jgi:negative regulator of sigma E activity
MHVCAADSVLVEGMSQQLQSMGESGGNNELQMLGAAAATSLVASVGVQPIEKKLVMDQLLESGKTKMVSGRGNPLIEPLREILAYRRERDAAMP